MTIASIETTMVELPLTGVATTDHSFASIGCVLVRVRHADGLEGQGFAYATERRRLTALQLTVDSFADLLIGRDPHDTEAIWHDGWRRMDAAGPTGVSMLALSAVDTAVWDLAARAVDLPLSKLLGHRRDEVATYASSGLFLSTPVERLGAEATDWVDRGFRAVKLRLGSGDLAEDRARARVVREAVGPDIDILVDANQQLDRAAAFRLGRDLESLDIRWFEDPLPTTDAAGLADLRRSLGVPIVAGEAAFARHELAGLVQAGSVDVLMPDLQRAGGVSEFRTAAAVAASAHVGVSTHFFTEYSLSLAGSIDAVGLVEHIDWFAPLFREAVELRNGVLVVPDRPGTGFSFDPDAVAAHRV